MKSIASIVAVALSLAGCASAPTHPDAYSFGVMGDTQYNAGDEKAFTDMMKQVDREDLAFVVHVGDFRGGNHECSDALFAARKSEFDASAHAFVYTPGDNEWVDCRGGKPGMNDPIERLAKLREIFFSDTSSLGKRRMPLFVQKQCAENATDRCRCEGLPENRFWTRGGVRFVTLNVPGSENNTGVDAANNEEAHCRNAANRAWLEQAVRASERSETRALVIFIQANPWQTRKNTYRDFVRQVERAAGRIAKPVLLVHGDTHNQRVDNPFIDSLGNPLPRLTRLETFGSPFTGWVKVTVDPDDPQVFKFDPRLFRFVPPKF